MVIMTKKGDEPLAEPKPVRWVASSRKELQELPEGVQSAFGYALYQAQCGKKSDAAKPLKGFGSASVLEIVEDEMGSTFRAVYTVKFSDLVYVLHVFQKKSKTGIKTSPEVIDKIKKRLKAAEQDYANYVKQRKEREKA